MVLYRVCPLQSLSPVLPENTLRGVNLQHLAKTSKEIFFLFSFEALLQVEVIYPPLAGLHD